MGPRLGLSPCARRNTRAGDKPNHGPDTRRLSEWLDARTGRTRPLRASSTFARRSNVTGCNPGARRTIHDCSQQRGEPSRAGAGSVNWRRALWIGLAIAVLSKAWGQWEHRAIHPADGVIAPGEPLQTDANGAPDIVLGRWTLAPRATYDITARILGREDYRFDPISDLVPMDLALSWGPMSDNQVLEALDISQGARFYSWRPVTKSLPIDLREVTRYSANTHVIPADASVASTLARLRLGGQVVHLTGMLVDGARDDGMTIRTSLTRTDSGAGACEFVLVQRVEVE